VTGISGSVRLDPTGRPGFPWGVVTADGVEIARVGRFSAFNTFLLRGQRIEVGERRWRMKGRGWHRMVVPVLVDEDRRRLADSAAGPSDYAITCRDRAFTLIPAEDRAGRPRVWSLLAFNEPVASIRRNPYQAEIADPIPLPALLMSWTLATLGCMGERDLVQSMGWTGPIGH
jgi:hypothetical protein